MSPPQQCKSKILTKPPSVLALPIIVNSPHQIVHLPTHMVGGWH